MLEVQQFRRTISVLALRIPNLLTEKVMRPLRDFGLRRPGMKIVRPDPADKGKRLFLLDETISSEDKLPVQVQDILKTYEGVEVCKPDIELSEKNFTLEEMLRTVIPAELDLPSSYEAAGHIAHLNLRRELLPYKKAIGEAFITKVPQIKTVVNKLDTIHEVFRTFDMELLAGEDRYDVEMTECGCRYKFDFRKVYWNSRLQVEHSRIVEACKEGDVVCDMFAGIGPFALPLAKRGLKVFANDLNPESYRYLLDNMKLNKVEFKAYNLDGREFVRQLCQEQTEFPFSVVLMNLPKDAVEFLDAFIGCMPNLKEEASLPRVFCYAFCRPDEVDDLRKRVRTALGLEENEAVELDVKKVRDVSPKKYMYCVEFTLPRVVVMRTFKRRKIDEKEEQQEEKKQASAKN